MFCAKHEFVETENEDTTPVFYKSSDITRILGCSDPTARQIMNRKDFPLIKVGKNYRVYKTAFEKWAMECRDLKLYPNYITVDKNCVLWYDFIKIIYLKLS